VRTQPVEMLCEFEPASGSVIANATLIVPWPMPRSQRSFWSGVPWRTRMLPTMAGETTISSSPVPAAVISSPTAASALMPSPPPSYSSGMFTPRNPLPASSSQSSVAGSPASRFFREYSGP
jgi:hypothetical protein